MKVFCLAIVVTLEIPTYVFCQNPKPLPPEWLHDGRIEVSELNFSIRSPAPISQWSYQEYPNTEEYRITTFTTYTPGSDNYNIMVMDKSGRMDSADTNKFLRGMVHGVQDTLPHDWQVSDIHVASTTIPVSASYKFTITFHDPGDSFFYIYGYIVSGKRQYAITCNTAEASEPLQFSGFVSSFSCISSNEVSSVPNPLGICVIVGLIGAVLDWRYLKRGGLKPTRKQKLIAWATLAFCCVALILIGIFGSGYFVGYVSVYFFITLFLLWEFQRWRVRRRHPARPALEITTLK